MRVTSVEREERGYYLTTSPNPKGAGLLCVISLGHPQKGDEETVVCDVEICPNMKAARKWYKRMMKQKPWQPPTTFVAEVPKGLGRVTGLRVKDGKLIAETESGTPMIVPLAKALKAE